MLLARWTFTGYISWVLLEKATYVGMSPMQVACQRYGSNGMDKIPSLSNTAMYCCLVCATLLEIECESPWD